MSNELDKHIQNQLRNYQSEVDALGIWEAVQPEPKKRRRWFFFLLFGLLGIGAISVLGYYTVYQLNSEDTLITTERSSRSATPAIRPLREGGAETDANSSLSNTNNSSSKLNTLDAEPAQQALVTTPTLETQKAKIESKVSAASPAKNTKTNALSLSNTPPSTKLSTDATLPGLPEGPAREATPTTEKKPNTIIAASKQQTTASNEQRLNRLELSSLRPLSLRSFGVERSIAKPFPLSSLLKEEKRRRRRKKKPSIFLQADGGYFGLARNLNGIDSLGTVWANIRDTTERTLDAWSFGASIGIPLNKTWYIRTGIAYTQINMEYSNRSQTISEDEVFREGIKAIVYQGNAVDTIFGELPITVTKTIENRIYNSIRQWEVPVLLGYQFEQERLNFGFEAGLRFQIIRNQEGAVEDDTKWVLEWEEVDWYRQSFDFSLQAGAFAAYELSDRLSAVGQLQLRYTPRTIINNEDIPYKEKYQLFGGSLGLRYRF